MSDNLENKNLDQEQPEQLSLNDDRRVKVLSPGAMVAKRFFRNRMAVVGLAVLVFMFVFSFVGGMVSPYAEDQLFYRDEIQDKDFAGVTVNTDYRYTANSDVFTSVVQAQTILAIQNSAESFTYKDVTYGVINEGTDFYAITLNDEVIGIAYKDIISLSSQNATASFDFQYSALKAYTNGETSFSADGVDYVLDEDGGVSDGTNEVAYVSRYIVNAIMSDVFLSRDFKEQVSEAVDNDLTEFTYVNENGESKDYRIVYDAAAKNWAIKEGTVTRVFDTYSSPSKEHLLGTDKNGMDMLTRIMYGGRVSLVIGFIVVFIETFIGIILGGISGYFGKWVDNLIMRVVDVFYCIPSTPVIIILGAVMDGMRVDPQIRMIYLMLILGFLGWPGIARLVRGQILSLREQEYMIAAEASGISAFHRIFRHLLPNVIPQLIVTCTMGLGSTILTEATLSFLGLGVKFPFASWGNIINDVNDTFVLTNYWFIWIPAGVCLLLTVLAFNLVGDGLRDAFDPKMKQ